MHINALDEVKVSVIDNEVWNSGYPRISQCNGFIINFFLQNYVKFRLDVVKNFLVNSLQ